MLSEKSGYLRPRGGIGVRQALLGRTALTADESSIGEVKDLWFTTSGSAAGTGHEPDPRPALSNTKSMERCAANFCRRATVRKFTEPPAHEQNPAVHDIVEARQRAASGERMRPPPRRPCGARPDGRAQARERLRRSVGFFLQSPRYFS